MRVNYEVDDLRAFCCLVRVGQYTAAASQLCITPSALSRRIAKLESEIGAPLFERTTRRLVVTPLALALYKRVLPVMGQLEACMSDAAREAQGQGGNLAVGAVASVGYSILPKVIPAFHRAYPDVYLSIRDSNATVVTQLVENGEVEFAVTTPVSFSQSLDVERIASYGFNLVFSTTSVRPLPQARVTWDQLAIMPVVGLHPLSSTRQQVDNVLRANGIALPWKIEVDQIATMIGLVQSGNFFAVMPALFDAAGYGLGVVPITGLDMVRDIYIVRRADATSSPQGRHLRDLVRQQLLARSP